MTEPRLIADPAEITSQWLTSVLNASGIDAKVTSFEAESIGTGQVGENVRFTLTGTGQLPATLVGKFPSPDPVSKQTGIQLNNYRREVHFYQKLQSVVEIQTPRAFFADINPETHDFVVIMEDLAPGSQGDQLGGCDEEAALLAVTQLARLHGPVWGDLSLIDGDLVTDGTQSPDATKMLYDGVSAGFLARYADRLTPAEKEMVQLVGENLTAYLTGYTGEPTLIHIDYRLDNMMFGGPYPLAVVDWQSIAFGCALNDLSYFMGTSLTPDDRASSEERLVRHYFDTLSTYNTTLTWEDCWRFYRHYAPAGLVMAVIASMIVGETDRGNDMFMVMARRSAQMSQDLKSIGVISSI